MLGLLALALVVVVLVQRSNVQHVDWSAPIYGDDRWSHTLQTLPRVPTTVEPMTREYMLHEAPVSIGQQARDNYVEVVDAILARAPANVLVFGLGNDTPFYYRVRSRWARHWCATRSGH